MSGSRSGWAVACLLASFGTAPVRAQEAYEATLVVAEGSDPYPVVLKVNERDRAVLRADSRRGAAPDDGGPSPLETQQAEMDLAACHAFFGDDAPCAPDAAPPPDLFDGARVPHAFTTAAPDAAREPADPAAGGASSDSAPAGGLAPGAVAAAGGADASPEASGGERDLSWLQGLTLPDLPVHWTDRLIWYLEQFREGGSYHNAVASWIRRSGRWGNMIRDVLRRHELPEDLLWVAAIESSFDPTERSSAGAVGLWQFMPEGGRDYGLPQSRWVDQRRNPEMATEAVALYFADLFARFGSWDLALAGFNMGYAGLERAILKYGSNDYWTLARTENALPYGTTSYVPKAIAVAIVARNLDRFGLGDLAPDAPQGYDLVEVRGVVRLAAAASAARSSLAELKALNPELLRDRTPPGEDTWRLRVPAGAEEGFVARLGAAREDDQTRTYTVRFGETTADVAARFRTTAARLRALNGLEDGESLRGGDVIEVPDVEPRDVAAEASQPEEPADVVVPADTFVYPDRERLFYRVVAGDRLESVAAAFGVTPAELVTWNVIDPDANLTPGLVLQVFAPPGFDRAAAVVLEERDVAVYVLGSTEHLEHLAREDGRERIVYVVVEGDTVESIARRFGTTKTSLTRVNRFGYDPDLEAGDEIVVWASPEEAARYRGTDGGSGASVVP
ncbi:MAG: LysM peptidoglycan-binding domain-containing protein [Deltaproteobacteria bacterium]|nr:LysM peptidoglycan-binding domain-containing protein [Deltaproteobacteria bacterium]